MQDFQSITGLAGRLFVGAAPPDIRRGAQGGPSRCSGASAAVAPAPEAVKCPRCESTNTKFCYYNNYNLSQPRHFCKSCRRYWTKGGVLRNVPVGGGCRKSKRTSSAPSAPSTPSPTDAKNHRRAPAPACRTGSSGSTSPTGASAKAPAPTPSTPTSNTVNITNPNPNPFVADVPPPAPIFADQAAALASLFFPPPPPPLPVFGFSAMKAEAAVASVFAEQAATAAATATATADMTPFASLDTGIFELGDTSPAYWNTGSCWTDVPDPTIYLP